MLVQTLFLFNHTGSALKNTCAWFLIKIFLFFTKSHVFCLKNENFQDIQLRKCFQFLLEVLRMCCTQQYLTTCVVYQFRKNTIFLTHFCRQRTDKENACAKFQKKNCTESDPLEILIFLNKTPAFWQTISLLQKQINNFSLQNQKKKSQIVKNSNLGQKVILIFPR